MVDLAWDYQLRKASDSKKKNNNNNNNKQSINKATD